MRNPILQGLTQNRITNSTAQVRNMFNSLKSIGNPQMMLQQMMSKNPNIKKAMDYIEQNGGDAKTAFYKMSKEMGVDPNTVLDGLK